MADERERTQSSSKPRWAASWSPVYTLVLAVAATAAYAWIVVDFLGSLRGAYSVESTRLLIVLTLIIAMLGFGGLLIARALFVGDGDKPFQDRFRLAREIFLVFSGIFGTIIGFYFGTTDQDQGTSPAIEIGYEPGRLTAAVTGGAEPFIGIVTTKDATAGETMTASKRLLTYTAAQCPEGATVLVVDGRGRRTETKVDCGTPAGITGGTSDEVGNAAANEGANST